MKSIFKILFVWAVLSLSQQASAVLINGVWVYEITPDVAGTPQIFVSPWGVSKTLSFDLNVIAADNYDFNVLGSSHSKTPSLPAWSTTVDAAQIVDSSGAVVANLTAANTTGANYNLYANSVALVPGRYLLNITTSCATWCTLSFNKPSFTISPSSINSLPPAIATSSLPDGTIGQEYNTANSGYVYFSTPGTLHNLSVSITGLPPGLVGNLAYGSVNAGKFYTFISGIPTTVGTSNVTITVTDTVTHLTTTSTLPLTVNDAAISFAPTLPDGTTNVPYSATIADATGGTGGFIYSQIGLPDGLSLTGNAISGTPTTAGLYTVNITATDSVNVSTTVPVTINIVNAAPVACSGTNAVITAYAARTPGFIVINGGVNLLDHLWTSNLNAGNTTFQGGLINWFQAGLIVDYTGVSDLSGCILSSLTVKPSLTISTTTLPNATIESNYTAPLTISGGVAPYNISIAGLPDGLSFDGANIVGTPLASGQFTLVINITDALGIPVTANLSLTVDVKAIVFAPSLPNGTVGTFYSTALTAIGGVAPFTFTATNLPAGLILSANNIVGTPSIAGATTVTLTATDAAGISVSQNVTLVINSAPGNYKISDSGQAKISSVGINYLMVGSKKLIWDAATNIAVNTSTGVKTAIDSSVKAGMKIRWSGMRDKKTNVVLTKSITIN